MQFADIHNHILFGVDDGARSEAEMYQIIDASYADGVRRLCFTPHYHPAYFGEHQGEIAAGFKAAQAYAAAKYSDLTLYLGNELRYERSCVEWLEQGRCRTLNGTQYLLVDFLYPESADAILDAMLRVLNAGYTPVLAHVERYESLHQDMREVERMKSWGVILQVDAQSPLGGLGREAKHRSRRLLAAGLIDIVASDAHDLIHRPPQLRPCFEFVSKKYGEDYAAQLFWEGPMRILESSHDPV
jgi:protein-tyrosine phosphatase